MTHDDSFITWSFYCLNFLWGYFCLSNWTAKGFINEVIAIYTVYASKCCCSKFVSSQNFSCQFWVKLITSRCSKVAPSYNNQLQRFLLHCLEVNKAAAYECIEMDSQQKQGLKKQKGKTGEEEKRQLNCEYEQMKQTEDCLLKCEKGEADKDWKCGVENIRLKTWVMVPAVIVNINILREWTNSWSEIIEKRFLKIDNFCYLDKSVGNYISGNWKKLLLYSKRHSQKFQASSHFKVLFIIKNS